MSNKKLLILYIDLDDDLGSCNIPTPIVGYDNVMKAAHTFALCKPLDSDVNALYRALQLYNELKSKGINVEISVASGCKDSKYIALERLYEKLNMLKELTHVSDAIVVFDSIEDEQALPIISQIFSIRSLEVVTVEQSRSIESTYAFIVKLFRKIIEEKHYSRLLIGYPGFLLLVLSILSIFNLLGLAIQVLLLTLSILMIIRGFDLQVVLKQLVHKPVKLVPLVLTALLFIIASYLSITELNNIIESKISISNPLAYVLQRYSHLFFVGASIPIVSKLTIALYRPSKERLLTYITMLTNLLLGYVLLQNITQLFLEPAVHGYALTNIVLITMSMIVITTIYELVKHAA